MLNANVIVGTVPGPRNDFMKFSARWKSPSGKFYQSKSRGPETAETSPKTDGPVCVSRKELQGSFLKDSDFLLDGQLEMYPNWNLEPGRLEDLAIPTPSCIKDVSSKTLQRGGKDLNWDIFFSPKSEARRHCMGSVDVPSPERPQFSDQCGVGASNSTGLRVSLNG